MAEEAEERVAVTGAEAEERVAEMSEPPRRRWQKRTRSQRAAEAAASRRGEGATRSRSPARSSGASSAAPANWLEVRRIEEQQKAENEERRRLEDVAEHDEQLAEKQRAEWDTTTEVEPGGVGLRPKKKAMPRVTERIAIC